MWRTILSTLEVVLPVLTMRGCSMDGGRVNAETTRRDVRLSGSSDSYFSKILELKILGTKSYVVANSIVDVLPLV